MFAGETFGEYRIMGKLANGGMASVYLARHLADATATPVALKVMLPHLLANPDYREMFTREEAMGRLLTHPNVVRVIERVESADGQALAMEFLDGRNLIQIVSAARRRSQAISFPVVARVIAAVSRALERGWTAVDAEGQPIRVIHRDVSPENVLLTYDGQVKLIDFGIAKQTHRPSNTRAGQLKGKYSYMSPEQVRGETLDHRSDQFSLSVLHYILLTGRKPFVAPNEVELLKLILSEDPVPPSRIDPTVPGVLEEVALRGLRKAPAARFPSHGSVADVLEDRYLSKYPAKEADIARLMESLFPAGKDAVRLRIQRLIDAEQEATVTGIRPPVPPLEQVEDELLEDSATILEGAIPDQPTANWRTSSSSAPLAQDQTEISVPEEQATVLTPAAVDVIPPPRRPATHHRGSHHVTGSHYNLSPSSFSPATAGLALLAVAALLALYFSFSEDRSEVATVQSGQGTLIVRASTGQAEVRINAELIGSTPIEKQLRAGRVSVLCSFRSREVVLKKRVDVMAGQRTETLCQLGHADLEVNGPKGWQVQVDDKPLQSPPVRLSKLLEGSHRIEWVRQTDGHKEVRRLRLQRGERKVVDGFEGLDR
ncbi:MAG: hypothetical protein CMH55_11090 [Myxococcales bacterium]|nr:hypothetical protein [Myxococcales bacterium]